MGDTRRGQCGGHTSGRCGDAVLADVPAVCVAVDVYPSCPRYSPGYVYGCARGCARHMRLRRARETHGCRRARAAAGVIVTVTVAAAVAARRRSA